MESRSSADLKTGQSPCWRRRSPTARAWQSPRQRGLGTREPPGRVHEDPRARYTCTSGWVHVYPAEVHVYPATWGTSLTARAQRAAGGQKRGRSRTARRLFPSFFRPSCRSFRPAVPLSPLSGVSRARGVPLPGLLLSPSVVLLIKPTPGTQVSGAPVLFGGGGQGGL